ncbi:putative receptor-like protein kinase At4g00960 [Tripterygium wilfordii]|uniref:putative receptor-like protein kinase At4g00960 n=1 Tax=Tripterygium wilfordii TaxID=458696 RepID=UPI0018F837C5|nr:putative receptor-like protein kinase At4g00960 [Tripterygium wilfordii]
MNNKRYKTVSNATAEFIIIYTSSMGFTHLVSLVFLIFTSVSPTGAQTYCDNAGLISSNSTYAANRNLILSSLASNASAEPGFYTTQTIGQEPNKVYAQALCLADSTTDSCNRCVETSRETIMAQCANETGGISWGPDYPPCIVRYSNRSIFGKPELSPFRSGYNTDQIASNQEEFDQVWNGLMENITTKASMGSDTLKYATGEINVSNNERIYALMQCTPDLSQSDCAYCLRESVSYFNSCCHGKQGGYVLYPSCMYRWDMYPFYGLIVDGSSPPALPQTNSTTGGRPRNISRIIVSVTVVPAVIFIAIFGVVCTIVRIRRLKQKAEKLKACENGEFFDRESFPFDFETIKFATNNFSNDNMLGQGGFGAVYKGRLHNGQDVAVKRLSSYSGQGDLEFKNEVMLTARLQHKNLVRVLGFCLHGNERIVIYELMPNSSLDHFLFDSIRRLVLSWEIRYNIIVGTARGILYLHEDSRLRVIHRDLKASNILLDEWMNPKISDFGVARLFEMDQTRDRTTRIVGTFGYMAPEYARNGHVSVKSDVFSFGVLVLEIICGQKNTCFSIGNEAEHLLTYAWNCWSDGTALNIMDPLISKGSRSEIMRCIHIALLCVQETVADRPTMAVICVMLGDCTVSLPMPSRPAYYMDTTVEPDLRPSQRNNHSSSRSGQSTDGSPLSMVIEASFSTIEPR